MTYYSQFEQDKYVAETLLPSMKSGVFVDIGADDGKRFSNSMYFEESAGFTGLCIEARKSAFDKLVACRTCICENVAVDVEPNEAGVEFLEFEGYGTGLSGIVKNYDPRHLQRIAREKLHPDHKSTTVKVVPTCTLQSLLDKYQLFDIDVLSIDIEGGELEVMKSLDWSRVRIGVIVIENNYNDPAFRAFFLSKGYRFRCRKTCDEIYSLA